MAESIKKSPSGVTSLIIYPFSDVARIYYGEASIQDKKAKIWISITVLCVILALYANFSFSLYIFVEFKNIDILKIIPINVFFLTAISLSAGLARFHRKTTKEQISEASKYFALSEITSTLAESEVDKIKIELANNIVSAPKKTS